MNDSNDLNGCSEDASNSTSANQSKQPPTESSCADDDHNNDSDDENSNSNNSNDDETTVPTRTVCEKSSIEALSSSPSFAVICVSRRRFSTERRFFQTKCILFILLCKIAQFLSV
jgi:hypothetical protein